MQNRILSKQIKIAIATVATIGILGSASYIGHSFFHQTTQPHPIIRESIPPTDFTPPVDLFIGPAPTPPFDPGLRHTVTSSVP